IFARTFTSWLAYKVSPSSSVIMSASVLELTSVKEDTNLSCGVSFHRLVVGPVSVLLFSEVKYRVLPTTVRLAESAKVVSVDGYKSLIIRVLSGVRSDCQSSSKYSSSKIELVAFSG